MHTFIPVLNSLPSFDPIPGVRIREKISIRGGLLSIQASANHSSTPKALLPLHSYKTMEVALMKDDEFTSIQAFTNDAELIHELNQYVVKSSPGVYVYVPVELVERLYLALKETV